MIKRPASTEKGQSLVEMALTATIMMFLMLATIDFGYGFLYWITIRDAAQEGAMYGSLHPGVGCEATLRNWVKGAATSPIVNISGLPDSQIVITRTGSTPGNAIKVDVTHYYHILTPMVSNFTGTPNIKLRTSVTNTILQVDAACP
jgi:hypothetical protein